MFVVESHEDVLNIIRAIVKRLGDSEWNVCKTAVEYLSTLEKQGAC